MKKVFTNDQYEFVLEKINKDFFNEKVELTVGYKFMSKWWWMYFVVPLIVSLLSTLVYDFGFLQSKSFLWIVFIIGEIIVTLLATYGIEHITTTKDRWRRILCATLLSIFLFSPWSLATKSYVVLTNSDINLPNFTKLVIIFAIWFFVISLVITTLTKVVTIYKDLSNLFGPIIPATLGKFHPSVRTKMDKILQDEVGSFLEHKKEYESIKEQAQAAVNAASVLVLPWITLLAILSMATKYITDTFTIFYMETAIWMPFIKSYLGSFNIEPWLQLVLLAFGILATLNVAKQTFINTIIVQSIARLSLNE